MLSEETRSPRKNETIPRKTAPFSCSLPLPQSGELSLGGEAQGGGKSRALEHVHLEMLLPEAELDLLDSRLLASLLDIASCKTTLC